MRGKSCLCNVMCFKRKHDLNVCFGFDKSLTLIVLYFYNIVFLEVLKYLNVIIYNVFFFFLLTDVRSFVSVLNCSYHQILSTER